MQNNQIKPITMTRYNIKKITTTTIKLKIINKNKECTLLNSRMNLTNNKILILPMKKMTF